MSKKNKENKKKYSIKSDKKNNKYNQITHNNKINNYKKINLQISKQSKKKYESDSDSDFELENEEKKSYENIKLIHNENLKKKNIKKKIVTLL